jgi:TolB-like protein
LGEQTVKNIAKPVRTYRARVGPEADVRPEPQAADAPPPLPDKPSIAVLPFENMSGDPEQEFFADGMTEDIITGLSRFRSLFVTARNSTFAYKDKSPDVREVARDLGVRYILEGSVRRGGERIRITGQLIDAGTGNHLWAERYDRELEDIFAVQDEVTEAIVAAIAPEIGDVERERAQRKPPDNLDAWGIYQRGLAANYRSTEVGVRSAIELFDRVNEIDPTFAPAFAMAAGARWRYVMHFEADDRDGYLNQAREKAYKAITLDPRDPIGLWNAGRVHSMLGQHDIAISKVEEAIALNPNDAMSRYFLGAVLCSAGRAKEAVPHIDHAMRLSPRDIFLTGMLTHRAFILFDLEQYDDAYEWARRASLSPNPRPMTFALLAAVLSMLGRKEEAQAALNDLLANAPGISCAKYRENTFGGPEVMERFADALREAGLTE